MKRMILWALPLAALAGCGDGTADNKGKAARVESLRAGQYEVTAEVTSFRATDKGTPKIDTKQGTTTTRSVCVSDGANLPPDLFADEGFTCRNAANTFSRGGSLNVNLQCDRAGLSGAMGYSVEGTFTADTFEARRQLTTRLSTDGDVVIASTLRGRRTGDCAPAGGDKGKSK